MKPVLGLVEYNAMRAVDDLCGHFLTTVGGKAVHENGVFPGACHEFTSNLIAGELLLSDSGFLFVAHADPDIGVDDVRTAGGLPGVTHDQYFTFSTVTPVAKNVPVRLVSLGAGKNKVHPHPGRCFDQGVGDVVAVADIGHANTSERSPLLQYGHQVSQCLAGMMKVGEGIDHRDRGVPGKFLYAGMLVCTDDHRVEVSREDLCGIGNGLSTSDLYLFPGEIERLPSELVYPRLEGNTRTGRGFLEDHAHAFSDERACAGVLSRFQVNGPLQYRG